MHLDEKLQEVNLIKVISRNCWVGLTCICTAEKNGDRNYVSEDLFGHFDLRHRTNSDKYNDLNEKFEEDDLQRNLGLKVQDKQKLC